MLYKTNDTNADINKDKQDNVLIIMYLLAVAIKGDKCGNSWDQGNFFWGASWNKFTVTPVSNVLSGVAQLFTSQVAASERCCVVTTEELKEVIFNYLPYLSSLKWGQVRAEHLSVLDSALQGSGTFITQVKIRWARHKNLSRRYFLLDSQRVRLHKPIEFKKKSIFNAYQLK